MLKNILKLKGVQELDKTEQKSIAGGRDYACLRRCQRNKGGRACFPKCGFYPIVIV